MTQNNNKAAREVSAALAPLSRRSVLKTGLWAVAGLTAVAAGGFALLRPSPKDSLPVPPGLRHLEPSHYHLFSRLIEVLLPTAGTALLPAAQVPIVQHIDSLLDALDPAIRKQWGGVLASQDLKFKSVVVPGDTLFMRSELIMKDPAGFSHFKVEARVGRRVATIGKIANFWFDMSKPPIYPG